MNFLSKMKLTQKVTLLIVASVVVSMMSLATVAWFTVSTKVKNDVLIQQLASIRVATQVLETSIKNVEVGRDNKGNIKHLTMQTIPAFENHEMIDRIGSITNETATVFAWDEKTRDFWRKTTNIKKPDGNPCRWNTSWPERRRISSYYQWKDFPW